MKDSEQKSQSDRRPSHQAPPWFPGHTKAGDPSPSVLVYRNSAGHLYFSFLPCVRVRGSLKDDTPDLKSMQKQGAVFILQKSIVRGGLSFQDGEKSK